MVLEDVTEYESTPEGGKRVTKMDEILLNGNNINMVTYCSCADSLEKENRQVSNLNTFASKSLHSKMVPGGSGPQM